MTGVSDTSLEAYCSIKGNGVQLNQVGRVYNCIYCSIKPDGLTRSEISKMTDISLNAVCGRVNELMKKGFIVQNVRRKCKVTGYNAYTLVTNPS